MDESLVSLLGMVAGVRGWILVVALFSTLCSCMYVPALRDDYSDMRDDVFTETIIKVRGIVDSRFVIDEFAGWVVGKDFFENKEIDYIWIYFSEAGGECRKSEPGSGELMCELDRKWKYKNIGADSDPVTWCVPGLKLMYKFKFSTERDGKDYWSDLEFGTESSTICPELFIE